MSGLHPLFLYVFCMCVTSDPDEFNAPGSLITHMQKTYRNRWCKPDILGNIPYHKLVQRLIGKLKFLSSQIPPKVLLANVRWHLNGFHTSRRYQKQGVCLFCNNSWSVDSIEHMSRCKSIRNLFPPAWHSNSTRRLFLGDGEGKECITQAFAVYALYCLHNEVRHCANPGDVALHLKWNRILVELPVSQRTKYVLHDIQRYQQ